MSWRGEEDRRSHAMVHDQFAEKGQLRPRPLLFGSSGCLWSAGGRRIYERGDIPDTTARSLNTVRHWAHPGRFPYYGGGESHEEAIRSAARRFRIEEAPEDVNERLS
jgi:hypothetical protein